jgi:hypothetical protein
MDSETTVILELYKIAVEMADRNSARRAGANTFFLTLNTVLAAAVGIVSSARRPAPQAPAVSFDAYGLVITSIAGIVLAVVWWSLLRYYRRLSAAKFDVINKIELRLPAQPYADEWAVLHPDQPLGDDEGAGSSSWARWRSRTRHREATVVEQVVPFVFMAVYIALGIRVILL